MGVLALTSLFSCGVDRWPEYYKWTGRDLWIDSVMREEYLWFEDIPDSKNVNYFLAPEAFLKSIRSSPIPLFRQMASSPASTAQFTISAFVHELKSMPSPF